MLKELGITHVVSMGESALTPPRPPTFSIASAFGSSEKTPTNSLWLEERLGNIAVLDMKDIADDGIDSIRPHMEQAIAFIEEARWQGGKVLVHCRVGVSRSASIVIAYLMKHIELDLASAYLLTRSRRLNILIQVRAVQWRQEIMCREADFRWSSPQPDLPFMATLHAFEADLLDEKDQAIAQGVCEPDDDSESQLGRAGLKRTNRIAWSFLSTEISNLNARFISCELWCARTTGRAFLTLFLAGVASTHARLARPCQDFSARQPVLFFFASMHFCVVSAL